MNNTNIKLASTEDYPIIAAIYNEYIRQGGATMEEEIHSTQHIQQWVDTFNERERLYVLREAETTIGWGIIKRYSNRMGYRFACETAIYVTASKLRQGYGSQMKKFLLEQSKALGYRHLVAKIFAKNIASIRYNEKLGYTIVGTQKAIGFRDNEWQDIVIMQYLL